jgi:hypothetical protein
MHVDLPWLTKVVELVVFKRVEYYRLLLLEHAEVSLGTIVQDHHVAEMGGWISS